MNKLVKKAHPYICFVEFGGAKGGAVAHGDSAYYPRKAYGSIFDFIYWTHESQEKEALHLIRKFYKKFEPYTSPYSYANLVDYDLGPDYLHAYYGSHIKRLVKIKNKYD